MKIVFSKKGLDSSNSSKPIILGEEIIMPFIPIPCNEEAEVKYSKIILNNTNMQDLCKELSSDTLYLTENKLTKKIKLDKNTHCHLDPQLINYFNTNKFLGSLGQVDAAEKHLENQGIGIGDLFLFYGWYKHDGLRKQVILGYLQIGDIIKTFGLTNQERKNYESKYPWLKNQPHWTTETYLKNKTNTIYIAREKCSFDSNISGFGLFNYSNNLVLTKANQSKKTLWQIPALAGCELSWNNGKCFDKNGEILVSPIGQEFVVKTNLQKAENWAVDLINRSYLFQKNKNNLTIIKTCNNDLQKEIDKKLEELSKNKTNLKTIKKTGYEFIDSLLETLDSGKYSDFFNYVNELKSCDILIITSIQFLNNKQNSKIILFDIIEDLIVNGKQVILAE